jgi:hypothetical protein
MILLPKGIQHPRFEEKIGGKGSWVMCHHQALEQLALKGPSVAHRVLVYFVVLCVPITPLTITIA